MARILITSGPTRQYLDPVRYLSNGSSGTMGSCLADAALTLGHEVVIVTGPVQINYPPAATVIRVVSTEEMLEAALQQFRTCDGVIGAAAPCDYRPIETAKHKLRKTGEGLILKLVETPDVLAALGQIRRPEQWLVGFALETEDVRARGWAKLKRKSCDLMVLNDASAIDAAASSIEMIEPRGAVVSQMSGTKMELATEILQQIQSRLIENRTEK